MQLVRREPTVRERGRVGAPDEHSSGLPPVCDHRAVFSCDLVPESDDAVGCRITGLVYVDLDGDRNAVKWPELLSPGNGSISCISPGKRLLSPTLHDSVDARIDLLDASQARMYRVAAGNLGEFELHERDQMPTSATNQSCRLPRPDDLPDLLAATFGLLSFERGVFGSLTCIPAHPLQVLSP